MNWMPPPGWELLEPIEQPAPAAPTTGWKPPEGFELLEPELKQIHKEEADPAVKREMETTFPSLKPDLSEFIGGVRKESKALGMAPEHYLTGLLYESPELSQGNFWQAGPRTKWGQHRGAFQWGEPQAAEYGVSEGMPIGDQLAAGTRYLTDRGFKPGGDLLDFYSTINAGAPGRYGASDRPGETVQSHVQRMLAERLPEAQALLAQYPEAPSGPQGMLEPGTLDYTKLPMWPEGNGFKTMKAASFNLNGVEVLIPTVDPETGKDMTKEQALERYQATGQHLGVFDNSDDATSYSKEISASQNQRQWQPPKGYELIEPGAEPATPATAGEHFARGVDITQKAGYDFAQWFGHVVGNKDIENWGKSGSDAEGREIKNQKQLLDPFEIQSLSEAGQFVKGVFSEQIPIMAGPMAGGLAGAGAGFMVGGPLGATIGGALGAFAPSMVLGTGMVQGTLEEKGVENAPGWVFAGGTAVAALDTVIPGKMGSMLVKKFGVEVAEEMAEKFLTRTLKGAGKGAAVESGTEFTQEILEEAAAAQGANAEIDWPSALKQGATAGIAGGIMGGGIGGSVAAIPSKTKAEDTEQNKLAPEALQDRIDAFIPPPGYEIISPAGTDGAGLAASPASPAPDSAPADTTGGAAATPNVVENLNNVKEGSDDRRGPPPGGGAPANFYGPPGETWGEMVARTNAEKELEDRIKLNQAQHQKRIDDLSRETITVDFGESVPRFGKGPQEVRVVSQDRDFIGLEAVESGKRAKVPASLWQQIMHEPRRRAELHKSLADLLESGVTDPEQIWQHPAMVETTFDQEVAEPKTVKRLRYNQGTGKWDETYAEPASRARREFDFDGEKVVGYRSATKRMAELGRSFAGEKGVAKERQAILVTGAPGVGKSTIVEGKLAPARRAAVVDADIWKQKMKEYRGGRGAQAVHKESRALADRQLSHYIERGENVIMSMTGQFAGGVQRYINQLRNAGYKVDVVNLTADELTIAKRVAKRYLETGRPITPDYGRGARDRAARTYKELRDAQAADRFAEIDTSGEPTIVQDGEAALGLEGLRDGRARGGLRGRAPDQGRVRGPQKGTRSARRLKRRSGQDFKQFIASIGGIKDVGGNLKSMGLPKWRGVWGVINNKTGLDPDKAREAAVAAGFIRERPYEQEAQTTIDDLLDLLDRAYNQGEKIYAFGNEGVAEERAAREKQLDPRDELDHIIGQIETAVPGFQVRPEEQERAARLYARGVDPYDIAERLSIEAISEVGGKETHNATKARGARGARKGSAQGLDKSQVPGSAAAQDARRGQKAAGAGESLASGVKRQKDDAQAVIPGAEPDEIGLLKLRAKAKLKAKKAQEGVESLGGLFGDEKKQGTLFSAVKRKAPTHGVSKKELLAEEERILREAYAKKKGERWVEPSDESLAQEYKIKQAKNDYLVQQYPTEKAWIEAVRRGRVVEVPPELDAKIARRTHTKTQESLLNSMKGYASYPKFRNEKTLQRLYDRVKAGEPLDMPLIYVTEDGKMTVRAGNTRLDVAEQLGVTPKAILFGPGIDKEGALASGVKKISKPQAIWDKLAEGEWKKMTKKQAQIIGHGVLEKLEGLWNVKIGDAVGWALKYDSPKYVYGVYPFGDQGVLGKVGYADSLVEAQGLTIEAINAELGQADDSIIDEITKVLEGTDLHTAEPDLEAETFGPGWKKLTEPPKESPQAVLTPGHNVWVNDTIIIEQFADKYDAEYTVYWKENGNPWAVEGQQPALKDMKDFPTLEEAKAWGAKLYKEFGGKPQTKTKSAPDAEGWTKHRNQGEGPPVYTYGGPNTGVPGPWIQIIAFADAPTGTKADGYNWFSYDTKGTVLKKGKAETLSEAKAIALDMAGVEKGEPKPYMDEGWTVYPEGTKLPGTGGKVFKGVIVFAKDKGYINYTYKPGEKAAYFYGKQWESTTDSAPTLKEAKQKLMDAGHVEADMRDILKAIKKIVGEDEAEPKKGNIWKQATPAQKKKAGIDPLYEDWWLTNAEGKPIAWVGHWTVKKHASADTDEWFGGTMSLEDNGDLEKKHLVAGSSFAETVDKLEDALKAQGIITVAAKVAEPEPEAKPMDLDEAAKYAMVLAGKYLDEATNGHSVYASAQIQNFKEALKDLLEFSKPTQIGAESVFNQHAHLTNQPHIEAAGKALLEMWHKWHGKPQAKPTVTQEPSGSQASKGYWQKITDDEAEAKGFGPPIDVWVKGDKYIAQASHFGGKFSYGTLPGGKAHHIGYAESDTAAADAVQALPKATSWSPAHQHISDWAENFQDWAWKDLTTDDKNQLIDEATKWVNMGMVPTFDMVEKAWEKHKPALFDKVPISGQFIPAVEKAISLGGGAKPEATEFQQKLSEWFAKVQQEHDEEGFKPGSVTAGKPLSELKSWVYNKLIPSGGVDTFVEDDFGWLSASTADQLVKLVQEHKGEKPTFEEAFPQFDTPTYASPEHHPDYQEVYDEIYQELLDEAQSSAQSDFYPKLGEGEMDEPDSDYLYERATERLGEDGGEELKSYLKKLGYDNIEVAVPEGADWSVKYKPLKWKWTWTNEGEDDYGNEYKEGDEVAEQTKKSLWSDAVDKAAEQETEWYYQDDDNPMTYKVSGAHPSVSDEWVNYSGYGGEFYWDGGKGGKGIHGDETKILDAIWEQWWEDTISDIVSENVAEDAKAQAYEKIKEKIAEEGAQIGGKHKSIFEGTEMGAFEDKVKSPSPQKTYNQQVVEHTKDWVAHVDGLAAKYGFDQEMRNKLTTVLSKAKDKFNNTSSSQAGGTPKWREGFKKGLTEAFPTLANQENFFEDIINDTYNWLTINKPPVAPTPPKPPPPPFKDIHADSAFERYKSDAAKLKAKMAGGLDMSFEAREARRIKGGWITKAYKGVSQKDDYVVLIGRDNSGTYDYNRGAFFTNKTEIANAWASNNLVYPVWLRTKGWKVIDYKGAGYSSHGGNDAQIKQARQEGYTGLWLKNVSDTGGTGDQLIAWQTNDIRSVNARFDEEDNYSGDMLASGVGRVKAELRNNDFAKLKQIAKSIKEATAVAERIAGPIEIVWNEIIPVSMVNLQYPNSADGETLGGYYRPAQAVGPKGIPADALIGLAHGDKDFDPSIIAGHEAFHHVERALATPAEMAVLTDPREMERIRQWARNEIGAEAEAQMPDVEVRAYAFQRYRLAKDNGLDPVAFKVNSAVIRVWERIRQFLRRVRNVLRGLGYDTIEDIFEDARTGKFAQRNPRYGFGLAPVDPTEPMARDPNDPRWAKRAAQLLQPSLTSAKARTAANGVRYLKNPGREQMETMLQRAAHKTLRGMADDEGNLYVWDANEALHAGMWAALGLGAGRVIWNHEGSVGSILSMHKRLTPEPASPWGDTLASGFKTIQGKINNLVIPPPKQPPEKWAGNINLDKIADSEDVGPLLKEMAEHYEGFMGARGGRISHARTREMAALMGIDPAKLAKKRRDMPGMREAEMLAVRSAMVAQGKRVYDLAEKAKGGSDEDKVALLKARAQLGAIAEYVAGETAYAGRLLNQFKLIAGEDKELMATFLDTQGQTIDEFIDRVLLLKDPAKVAAFSNRSLLAKTTDVLFELWINALLSGPVTQATNVLSNTLVAIYQVPEAFVAGLISKVTGSGIPLSDATYRAFGLMQGISDGVKAAVQAAKTEEPTGLTGKIEARHQKAIPGKFGRAVRIPGLGLLVGDEFFKAVNYRAEINSRALRMAVSEGLKGQALAKRVADLVANPTDRLIRYGRAAAERQTFTNKAGRVAQIAHRAVASIPGLRYVIPFIRTPANIVSFAVRRSPFAPLFADVRADLKGENGAQARDEAIARIALGSMVSTWAIYMAAQALLTGGGPDDPKERSLLYATGWQPYSIKIGDTYYSYARFEPLSTLLGVATDAFELQKAMSEEEKANVAGLVIGSITRNLTNKTFLRGLAEVFEVTSDPKRYAYEWVKNFSATLVPTGVAQLARTRDPYLREARTILDNLKSRVPGLRETLPKRHDPFGAEIKKEGAAGPDILSPVFQSTLKDNPPAQEMVRLGYAPGMPGRKIMNVELTPEQYEAYAIYAGQNTKEAVEKIMARDSYQRLSDDRQKYLIKRVVDDAREKARAQMLRDFPDLKQQAKVLRKERRMVVEELEE